MDSTFVTHALGVAGESRGAMMQYHLRVSSMSDSDHIGDIVPGIEVDEERVELAVRESNRDNETTDANLAVPGVLGKERNNMGTMIVHHPDSAPSEQVEMSQIAEVEDDLDQVLMDM